MFGFFRRFLQRNQTLSVWSIRLVIYRQDGSSTRTACYGYYGTERDAIKDALASTQFYFPDCAIEVVDVRTIGPYTTLEEIASY